MCFLYFSCLNSNALTRFVFSLQRSMKFLAGVSSMSLQPLNYSDVAHLTVTNTDSSVNSRVTLSTNITAEKLNNIFCSGFRCGWTRSKTATTVLKGFARKHFTFLLKLLPLNFSSKHLSFTISKIYDRKQCSPLPNFYWKVSLNSW